MAVLQRKTQILVPKQPFLRFRLEKEAWVGTADQLMPRAILRRIQVAWILMRALGLIWRSVRLECACCNNLSQLMQLLCRQTIEEAAEGQGGEG